MAKRVSGKQAAKNRTATKKLATTRSSAKRSAARRSTAKRPSAKRSAASRPTKRAASKKAAPKRSTAVQATAKRRNAARAAASRAVNAQTTTEQKPSTLGAVTTAVRGTVAGAVAAVTRRISRRGATDAIVLLEADHRRMEDLLKRGEETTERAIKGRKQLLDTLTAELTVHELLEEQVLYPALQAHPEAKDIVLEGFQEHHVADLIVKELHEVATDNEQWGAKFKVLKESIEHHIQEEEGKMFRTARAVLGQEELDAMGAQMVAMKS